MPLTIPPTTPPPSSYAGAATALDQLDVLVSQALATRKLTVKQAAVKAGLTTATLSGVAGGSNCTRATAAAVLRWLAT